MGGPLNPMYHFYLLHLSLDSLLQSTFIIWLHLQNGLGHQDEKIMKIKNSYQHYYQPLLAHKFHLNFWILIFLYLLKMCLELHLNSRELLIPVVCLEKHFLGFSMLFYCFLMVCYVELVCVEEEPTLRSCLLASIPLSSHSLPSQASSYMNWTSLLIITFLVDGL